MSQYPEISDPAEPTGIDFNQLHGSLLLIEVVSREDNIRTRMDQPGEPPKTAMAANVSVLDGQLAGQVFDNVLIFPRVLVQQLKPKVGEWVVGRLGQGIAEGGKSAPWKLEKATDQDRALARQWFSRNPASNAVPPATSYQPPPTPPQQQQQAPAWTQPQGQLPVGGPPAPAEPPF